MSTSSQLKNLMFQGLVNITTDNSVYFYLGSIHSWIVLITFTTARLANKESMDKNSIVVFCTIFVQKKFLLDRFNDLRSIWIQKCKYTFIQTVQSK